MKQDALISLGFDYLHYFQTCHTLMSWLDATQKLLSHAN